MSDRFYETEPSKKKLKIRPLVPTLSNKDTETKYALVYDDCSLFEALEYIAYGTKPIRYPDKVSFFLCCPTCSLRQAIELLALRRIPTDADGEKFNNYNDRQYLSEAACEQLRDIERAIPKLEVLIDKQLVKCMLVDDKGNSFQAKSPVMIELTPSHGEGFTLTCNGQKYTNAEFDFNELEKAFKDYSQPQTVYKLTVDDEGIYLQVNSGSPEKLRRFNHRVNEDQHKALDILKKVISKPGETFRLKDFSNINSFKTVLKKIFANKKLDGIKDAFFDLHEKTIKFNGDVTNLVRIRNKSDSCNM